ncbi:MAG TPA: hypothetical protein VFS21_04830 [Roseiflexaceae bacterium]|nr:hypothetical protein [Roseiflexaceae bacterium]
MSTTLEVQDLLREGRAAALAGDSATARTRFRRATELDPQSVEAWLGLSGVVPVLAEKREYLVRALELAPDNQDAAGTLRVVDQLIAEGRQIAPSQRFARPEPVAPAPEVAPSPTPVPGVGRDAAAETMYCYIHPTVETGLLCVQCNRPICGRCARPAAVGQLCPECRRERRPVNYKVSPGNLAATVGVTLLLATIAGALLSSFAFGGLFLGLILGWLVAEGLLRVLDRVTHGKRGRAMQIAAGAALLAGTCLGVPLMLVVRIFPVLLSSPVTLDMLLPGLLSSALAPLTDLGGLAYLLVAIGTLSVRLK